MLINLQKSSQAKVKYERGLEIVPLLIHLPPGSEDTEANGRDIRDVVDENISRAQIIYNIISSTAQKSFKNRYHGQRHFGFEIVGVRGFVYMYGAVPADMVDVLEQALTSAYPSTRVERVPEHNIFNEVGGINAVVGGQFNLKDKFAYPIATYQDLKRDAFQGILNALSTLGTEDGAAIQILFRPADEIWRKEASTFASAKRKGTDKGLSAAGLAKDLFTALSKAPEAKDSDSKPKELSSLEQSVVDAIDDKTRYAGFEVAIRVVASSNIMQQSQSIINNITASFSLFDAPGKNGFSYTPAKSTQELITNYLLRAFPYHKKKNILNSVELATLFHFPDQRSTPTSQLTRQESKQVDGPRNIPDQGLMLGFNVFRGIKKPIRISLPDRQRHLYAVGQTGTGKSTFLENLALQDMINGDGFAFIDPHGDTAENLLAMVPKERTEDVIYFCPFDMDYPMGLNLFEYDSPDQKDFLIQEVLNMLYKLYDPQRQGIMGPRYESIFRNCALAIMADPEGGTFIDVPKLFRDPDFLKQKLQHVTDINVLDYWQKEYPASQRSNEAGEVTSWFVSKFGAFLSNEMMRNIIGQTQSAFNLREIMDNKKILLVNLSKGRTGELNSKLLGMIFVMKFQAAAMSRANVAENQRPDFALYVDEFQNFSTDSFATILSEARKFHLNLIVANQFTTQLTEEIRDAVFGNIGTIVSYRVGQNDVESLSRYFQPQFDGDDLLRIPNYNCVVRTMVNGVPTQPFSMAALPPLGQPNPGLGDALKQLSAAKYGRPRAIVEKEIFARLTPKTPTPAPGTMPGASSPGQGMLPPQSGRLAPPTPTSFLDEWLSKQKSPAASSAVPMGPSAVPAPQPLAPTPVAPAQLSQPPLPPATQPHNIIKNHNAPLGPGPDSPINPFGLPQEEMAVRAEPALPPSQVHMSPPSSVPDTGNISSAQLDKQEVDDIAAELRKNLAAAPVQSPTPAPAAVEKPAPAPTPARPENTEGTVALNAKSEGVAEDTIFIDKDGNIKTSVVDEDS